MLQRRAWWGVVAMAVALIFAIRAIRSEHNSAPRAALPKTEQVAETLRNEGPLSRRPIATSSCRESSPGHWACTVKFTTGAQASVQGVWNGQAVAYSLTSERGPAG